MKNLIQNFLLFATFLYSHKIVTLTNEIQEESRNIKFADIQKFKLADWIKKSFKVTRFKPRNFYKS